MTSSPGNDLLLTAPRWPARGFTLTELLTVMAIIALIGGLSASAYQVARRNYALSASAGRIQGVIRAARNTALSTATPSTVIVDPVTRTVTANAFERVGEWSFEASDAEAGSVLSAETYSTVGATPVDGRVGSGLSFRSRSAYVDCGDEARFKLRTGVFIEAWVRHFSVQAVKAPAVERKERQTRLAGKKGSDDEEPAAAIVSKGGAYFLGMTASGALEGSIGEYRVRTRPGVVAPERWVHVTLRYDGKELELSADGVPREALPPEKKRLAATEKKPVVPSTVPVTAAPLTISSKDSPFPGDIDEVKLAGSVEPLSYRWADHEQVLGWKKVLHFDRYGHLDPRFHPESVRLVLVELPDEDAKGAKEAKTSVVVVDYTITFDEWLARWDNPPAMRQSIEEAKLEAMLASARKVVVEVDRLGVVR
jgi:prepilin-type N-terminal cleavage/methylation domain-containing protein